MSKKYSFIKTIILRRKSSINFLLVSYYKNVICFIIYYLPAEHVFRVTVMILSIKCFKSKIKYKAVLDPD